MDYQNLDQEIKVYSNYFKYCDSINAKFLAFFRQFIQSGSKFLLKTKKSMDEFESEIIKEEYFPSTLNKSINNYCKEFKGIMDKFQEVISNIEKNIINNILDFDKNYKTNCKNSITNLTNLNLSLSDNKNKLEKVKNNYFDSCKQIQEYDIKYISSQYKETIKEEEFIKIKEQFEKMKEASETKKVYYRIEVTKFNDLLLSNEQYYTDIINSIIKQEEDRIQFFSDNLLSLNNSLIQYNSETKDSLIKNLKNIDDVFPKRDTKMFSLYFNKTNNNKDRTRFLFEEFFDFENIKTPKNKIEPKEKDQLKKDIKSKKEKKDNDINYIMKLNYKLSLKIIEIGKEPLIDVNTMDNEFIELDNILFNLIHRDEKLTDEKYVRIISTVEGNYEGCKNIIYLLMGYYCNNNLVKFNSIENFFLLNSILNIINNFISENDDYVYLAFFIIYIGEKTVFYGDCKEYPSNYLCKILSKNSIYHTYEFWNRLINLKIKMLAKIKIKEEFKLRRKNNTKRDSFISKFFGSNDDNDKIESEILYSQIYREKSNSYLNEILEEYIGHFINYEFIEKKTFNLIEHLSEKYYLNARQKNYFIKMIQTNSIYKKETNPFFRELKIKSNNTDGFGKVYSKYILNKKYKKIKTEKIKIISFTMKYLSNKDLLNLLSLNKECYSTLKKYIYKSILIKYYSIIDTKKHVLIWKILLDYTTIKTKYNYASIKESLIINNKSKDPIFDTIELDCMRTTFTFNQESNQIKLGNVLKMASKYFPSVNYCQGMNHIAAFFLILCEENEEETFYLFLSFLFETDYCSLVENDLNKLNKFFYCFERILCIMLPEMNNYLMSNNVNGGYFLSPWFITLFTIGFYQEKEKNNSEIIMKLIDIFIFSGWKAIFKIGIILIRNNSGKIFSLPDEQLVHYLNNELTRSDFFKYNKTKNEDLINIFINFKLSNKLLNNLYEEYELKQNILNKNN